jgi:hypothetical protein
VEHPRSARADRPAGPAWPRFGLGAREHGLHDRRWALGNAAGPH